jgi:hypothetical protein
MSRIDWTVPGPSPWYLERPSAALKDAAGPWTWQFSHEHRHMAGMSVLNSPRNEPVLLLDFHCYVLPLEADRFLVWHEHRWQREVPAQPPHVLFVLLSLSRLSPIEDLPAVAAQMRRLKQGVRLASAADATYRFMTSVEEGIHPISAPEAFNSLPELLVLADYGPSELAGSQVRAIFDFSFKRHRVAVIPQKWFNTGGYDYGYQWIARVQRGSRSGQIVGEGVRLGTFRLDPSGTQIERWLHRDELSHPERE